MDRYIYNFQKHSGPEVSFDCPYCPDGDSGSNLWYNVKDRIGHCWKCGKVIGHLEILSFRNYKIVTELDESYAIEPIKVADTKIDLPEHLLDIKDFKIAVDFIKSRGLDVDEVREWGVKFCPLGKFRDRLIIPIYEDGVCVGFQARGLYPVQKKYLNPEFKLKNYLFGIDFVVDYIVVVEGVFDALKYGKGAVALFGKFPTGPQLDKLVIKNLPIIIMLDDDAFADVKRVQWNLGGLTSNDVKYVRLPKDSDPADFTRELLHIFVKQARLGSVSRLEVLEHQLNRMYIKE